MYTNFFSLSELPFSIAPNPKYLFMSDRHREALNHLNQGLGGNGAGENGGFVLLTGEVGTGKTTVSRCLMADLPQDTQLAFILNPTLSSQELLATICDQLKVRYRKTGATLKTLTDKISEKLLKNHSNNINTLLIIDEAQHLAPDVLEQLRLLTNLETDTKKLLQVILIGQPELQQLLKRRDLRQLAQRITARYHLLPLNQNELAAYIKHRLSVADCHRALFSDNAIKAIHKLSNGVPRLVNLLCHSALMEAYNSNNAVVDKKIVYKAASQAIGDEFEQPAWWQNKNSQLAMSASVLLLVLFSGIWLGKSQQDAPQINTAALKESSKPILVSNEKEAIKVNKTPQSEDKPASAVIKKAPAKVEKTITPKIQIQTKPTVKATQSKHKVVSKNQLVVNNKVEEKPAVVEQSKDFQVKSVDGVSKDLLSRFQAAVDETEHTSLEDQSKEPLTSSTNHIKPLTQMPAWVQKGIPPLKFEQHIYASDGQGWVNVNGRDRYEGDVVADGLTIEKILPQQVIMTYRGETFSLPALTNW